MHHFSSSDKAGWIVSEARPMRKLRPASVAESQTYDSSAEIVCNNKNSVEHDDGVSCNGDDVVFRCNSSSSDSSDGLCGARRCLITGKDAAGPRAADGLSLASAAWRNDGMHNSDSLESVDEHQTRDKVAPLEQDNSTTVDDEIDCSCLNRVVCTTSEV